MSTTRRIACWATLLLAGLALPDRSAAQIPLGIRTASGLTVTPAFEGWYPNADGTFSLSFGYYNRNFQEVVDIPVGPDNHIAPATLDGQQPTRFHPRRHWGVFAVVVPADFGEQEVVWTIDFRGEKYAIPGSLHTDWQIDALEGEAGSGNTPPVIAFSEGGAEGAGPGGIWSGPIEAGAGMPVSIAVWARDDGRGAFARQGEPQVALTWFKHQGPGDVAFSEASGTVPVSGGTMMITATFAEPGSYVLRVRANDASGVSGAGHAQCCWSNGFLRVNVTH